MKYNEFVEKLRIIDVYLANPELKEKMYEQLISLAEIELAHAKKSILRASHSEYESNLLRAVSQAQ
jgi:hypothetical protein